MSDTKDDSIAAAKYYVAKIEMQNRYKLYRAKNKITREVGTDGRL